MRVAIAQISPVFLNRSATLEKAVAAVKHAAAGGARLVAFGETLIPAYPLWLSRTDGARFDAADQKELHARYLRESVDIDAGHLDPLRDAARDANLSVVVGIAERPRDRGGHSIYCSCVFIDESGDVRSIHRKLMPTYEERLSWGIGDGAGLVTHCVDEFTVGALNCWENWMPLARAALYARGENLHVAIWPGCKRLTQDITRFIARESRSFVLSASSIIRAADIPRDIPHRSRIVRDEQELLYDGGSCIAGPDGEWIIPPLVDREDMLFADLSIDRVLAERQSFDPVGHYARPDVLRLSVNRRRQSTNDGECGDFDIPF